jgi:riboflavin synthase
MFTGIVSDLGTIAAAEQRGDLRVRVATGYDVDTVDLGASVSCSGVCLTVVDKAPGWLAFDVSSETVSRTSPDQWQPGARLNLERALRLGDELGGHIVTGHVDGIGTVTEVRAEGDSRFVAIAAGHDLAPFIAAKGSITLDGVSLTVNEVADDAAGVTFTVNLIPHTAAVTTLGTLAPARRVNLEIDVLARYLRRMEALRAGA